MGAAILHEASFGLLLEDSLAYSLGKSALQSRSGGCMGRCLLPLHLFNAAAGTAAKLPSQELQTLLSMRAEKCLDALLQALATQVCMLPTS